MQLRSVSDGIDPATTSGRLMLNMLATLAEYERELIVERVNAGIAAARKGGTRFGRPLSDPVVIADKLRIVTEARAKGRTAEEAARLEDGAPSVTFPDACPVGGPRVINVQRLRLLRELSFLGTISAVADSMGLTRPVVSQQLSQLEKDTGLVLVERAGRTVRLTGAGIRLVEQSHEVFESLERIDAEIAVTKNSISGDIRISVFPSFSATVLPTAMALLRGSHSQLRSTWSNTSRLKPSLTSWPNVRMLRYWTTFPIRIPATKQFFYQPLFAGDFYVVMSEQHPYRKLDTVPLAHLASEDWALNRSARIYHTSIVDACLGEGFRPNITCDCKDTTTVLQMIRAGLAISVLPGLALIGRHTGLIVRPLDLALRREVLFATLKGRANHPAILECFRAMRSSYARCVQPGLQGFADSQSTEHPFDPDSTAN